MDDMLEGYTFDDVLIVPKFTNTKSRKDVDLSTVLDKDYESGPITLKLPILSANMETITGSEMAIAMIRAGGMGILHRFQSIPDNLNMLEDVMRWIDTTEGHTISEGNLNVGVSIGITDGEKERAEALIDQGDAYFVCIDVAHGAQQSVVDQYNWLRSKYKDNIYIMVGNFATSQSLIEFLGTVSDYPNAIKVGIGPGSACTTRIKTGVGVPQLSAIMDIVSFTKRNNIKVIADGGMKTPGDIAKALAAGAHMVMLGGMLAGTDETPGKSKIIGSQDMPSGHDVYIPIYGKEYKGSASSGFGNGWKTSEGVSTVVTAKGPVENILKDIEGGLRSAFTYTNSRTLEEFQENAKFMKVSTNTKEENKAHILK